MDLSDATSERSFCASDASPGTEDTLEGPLLCFRLLLNMLARLWLSILAAHIPAPHDSGGPTVFARLPVLVLLIHQKTIHSKAGAHMLTKLSPSSYSHDRLYLYSSTHKHLPVISSPIPERVVH